MAKAVKHSAIRNFSGTSSRISGNRWRMTNIILTTKTKRKTSMKKQQNNFTRGWARQVALSIALLSISAVLLASSSKAAPFTFDNTGSLNIARYFHTTTLLPNGKVLVTGGDDGVNYLTSAELYDPTSGTWSATGSLTTARSQYTATLLPNGKVLVAGGVNNYGAFSSAELYDPANGTWSATGSLTTARGRHTATLLPNGKVLVPGGENFSSVLNSAELYDPASGTWSATGSLSTGRAAHTATLLPNGKVLVAAGEGTGRVYLSSAELDDR